MKGAEKVKVLPLYILDCILGLANKFLFEDLRGLGVKYLFMISLRYSGEISHTHLNVMVPTLKAILLLMGSLEPMGNFKVSIIYSDWSN